MTEKQEWAWMRLGDEQAHGLYKSRAEVIEAVQQFYEGDAEPLTVCVGRPVYPDPADFAEQVADVDALLERMDDAICDGYGEFHCDYGDPMFETTDGAERALRAALRLWARGFVKRIGPWTLREGECERVDLAPVADGVEARK